MPIFDSSVLLNTSRAAVIQTVKASLPAEDTLIVLREAPIFISLGREFGYVYSVAADGVDSTQLRLIVDRTVHVRDAFRGSSPRAALEALTRTSRGNDPLACQTAQQTFESLQARIAAGPAPSHNEETTASLPFARLFSRPRVRATK